VSASGSLFDREPATGVEREVKLEAGSGFRMPDLTGLPDVAEVVVLPAQTLKATYVDTPGLLLARAGVTLRHRAESDAYGSRDLWTLKLPAAPDGVTLGRHELTWPGGPPDLPPEAVRLVRAITLGDRLSPVARLATRRRRLELRDPLGAPLVEISDDRVTTGRRGGGFRELEVELSHGASPSVASSVADRLTGAGASAASPRPKLVRALGPEAQAPPDVVVDAVGGQASVRDLVAASIARAFTALTAHEPGVRLEADPEHVHKARVAVRRLRSDLRTFRPLLSRAWVTHVRDELKWAGGALGAARDADVLEERLRDQLGAAGDVEEPEARELLGRLTADRGSARAHLVELLDGDRYLALLIRLRDAALDPPMEGVEPSLPAANVAPDLVRGAWKRVRKGVKQLGSHPSDAALHEVRKRAKALRYACEALFPATGKQTKKLGRKAEGVQEVLGEMQDAVVARAWLEEEWPPDSSKVVLRLIERQESARSDARTAWPKAWTRLRKAHKAWAG
jgi:CHAD domain-containing protein